MSRIVADNLAQVEQQIAAAADGRSIRLVCVTKYAQVEWCEALLDAGATELGESHLPQGAARFEFLQQSGFKVKNLAGGIQAWSEQIDPKVPKY